MQIQAQRLREMVQRHQQNSENKTRVIAVSSGKGGVGKSVFTVNLAIALSRMGKRPLIVDADFGLANIDIMLGVTAKKDLTYVTREYRDIRDIIMTGHCGVQFVSGGNGVYDLLKLSESELNRIVENLMHLNDLADFIIFDTGAGINDNVLRLVRASDEMIIITTPEPTAILDAYALVKTAARDTSRWGAYNRDQIVRLVVNKIETVKEANAALTSFSGVIKNYTGIDVDPLGYIVFDPAVTRAIKRQEPLMISYPASSAASNINDIADKLLNEPGSTKKKDGGMSQFIRYFTKEKNL